MAKPTPATNATTTTFQIGTYTPINETANSDGFTLGLDMNDGATWQLMPGTLSISREEQDARSDNLRTPGEYVVANQYKNMHISASFSLSRKNDAAGTAQTAMLAQLRTLLPILKNPPFCIRIALPYATQYSYADVVKVVGVDKIPLDPRMWSNKALIKIDLVFECAPGFRGDRVTLSNLVPNPGFEAPGGGGTTQTPPAVFNDAFPNVNAYANTAGSAPISGTAYVDTILAALPACYFRLDETSGTTAVDISGHANNGTTHGSPTQNVAGLIASDTDACYTFAAASSQYISSASGLSSGNASWSLEAWFKFASNPASGSVIIAFGGATSGTGAGIYIDTAGKLNADQNAGRGAIISASPVATGVAHHTALTWDGTTMRLYLDGAQVGTPTTPGAMSVPTSPSLFVGANAAPGAFWTGQLDETATYAGTLSAAQVLLHYNVGHSGPASNPGNYLYLPAGATSTFGSPAWGAIQSWQVRFQYATGGSYYFCLHYTDANNALRVDINAATQFITQVVGGVAHTVASAAVTMTNGNWYWLIITQFPSNAAPQVQATLYADSAGALGSSLAALGPVATYDAATALSGHSAFVAVGAPLVVGGNYTRVQVVQLFGPGGWYWNGANGGTGLGIGAWDGTRPELGMGGTATVGTQTYGSGPATSFGSLRIDFPPSGTCNGFWETFSGGAPAGTSAIPVTNAGDTLGVVAYAKSSGLGAQSASILMQIREWDASGALLRATTVQSLSGNQASWTKLSGTVTTGASCAYASLLLLASDTTTGSVNGTVWFDNVQVWNETQTGQTTMPYCELRFPNSAAQLIVSGLAGDMIAPAYFAFGAYVPSWIPGATNLTWVFGRQAVFQNSAARTAQACGRAIYVGTPTPTLDTSAYNGFYTVGAIVGGVAEYDGGPQVAMQGLLGTYHVFMRARSTQATIANVTVTAGYYQASGTNGYATESSQVAPFAAANTWTAVDCGQMQVPASPSGGITGTPYSANTNGYPRVLYRDPTGGGSNQWGNWWAAIPVDGSMIIGNFFNPSNSGVTVTNSWVWGFSDPLALNGTGGSSAWRLTVNTNSAPGPTNASGGPNGGATQFVGINASGDAYITLDPVNGGGTNLLVGYVSDGLANVLATHVEMQYSPRYLAPR